MVDDDCDGGTDEGTVCETAAETHVVETERGARALELEVIADPAARSGLAIRPREGAGARSCTRTLVDSIHPILIERPGAFHLWARMKGLAFANDALCVGFDSMPTDRVFPPSLGGWTWVQVEVSNGSGDYIHLLDAGLHEILVTRGEELAMIDALCVTNQLAEGPAVCDSAVSEEFPVEILLP